MKKVRSEITSAIHSLPWLIARDDGLFEREGLEVEFIHAPQRGTWKALIEEIPPALGRLTVGDFHLPRLRCTDPAPYSETEFRTSVEWMRRWDLIGADTTYLDLVDNRLSLATT